MRNLFAGYYAPTAEQYKTLWTQGLIVLDANVILNLYRIPNAARDEVLTVLESVKNRLWIPHQVALEFQRNRLKVISSERHSTEEALQAASDSVFKIKTRVNALEIDKRGLGISSAPLLKELEDANDKLLEAIRTVHESQLDVSAMDPIRMRVDEMLQGRIGAAPSTQGELDALVADGEVRFNDQIPPGFLDAEKDKNPKEATFIFDRIRYVRKFGDLILWKQLIQYAKECSLKNVLLVTSDKKEDWWWKENGKTIGPHPELVREIQKEGDVELFWMYTSAQFVENANTYIAANVSKESVAEIKLAAQNANDDNRSRQFASSVESVRSRLHSLSDAFVDRHEIRRIEGLVANWLQQNGEDVELNTTSKGNRGFPDLIVSKDFGLHGYDVKFIRSFDRMLFTPITVNALLRGYLERSEGRLAKFSLVLVLPETEALALIESGGMAIAADRVAKLLERYPVDSIILGGILDGNFSEIVKCDSNLDQIELF